MQRGLHVRDRRRGRLDPDRRGAHAAHHLGPGRRQRRPVLPAERARAEARRGRPEEKGAGDYWVDEKAHQVLLSEEGHEHAEQILAAAGLLAAGLEPLRRAQHRAHASPVRGAARARAVPSRPALRRAERRGDHRRRVHRPADVRAAAGPTACTRRSRRRKACRSSARTRRSRRSRSRTISACTASSPA